LLVILWNDKNIFDLKLCFPWDVLRLDFIVIFEICPIISDKVIWPRSKPKNSIDEKKNIHYCKSDLHCPLRQESKKSTRKCNYGPNKFKNNNNNNPNVSLNEKKKIIIKKPTTTADRSYLLCKPVPFHVKTPHVLTPSCCNYCAAVVARRTRYALRVLHKCCTFYFLKLRFKSIIIFITL